MKLIRALMHSISRIWDHPLAVQSFFLCLLPIFFVCFRVFLCVICFCVLLCIFLCKFCILHLLCCLWFCLFAPYFCDVIPPPPTIPPLPIPNGPVRAHDRRCTRLANWWFAAASCPATPTSRPSLTRRLPPLQIQLKVQVN